MPSRSQRKRIGSEHLHRIIGLCRSTEEEGLDPFLVDVDDVLETIRGYFQEWKSLEELCLDAETIHRLASVIKIQSDWVKHRSTSLYTDPFLLEEKVRKLSKAELVNVFLQVWHPIIEFEQLSPSSLNEATKYWQGLLPLDERWLKITSRRMESGTVTRDELIRQRILTEETFSEGLEAFWRELVQKSEGRKKILYWDFIGAETYHETVERAYLTSFLVTYGYATMEIDRLEEEIFIRPYDKPSSMVGNKQVISIPVSVSSEEWMRWKQGRRN